MITTCIYCGNRIKTTDAVEGVSHGICHECLPDALHELSIPVVDYLESVPYPALLVDEQGNPVAANTLYQNTIGPDTETGIKFVENLRDNPSGKETRFKKTDTVRMKVQRPVHSPATNVKGSAEICQGGQKKQLNLLLGLIKMGSDTIVEIKDMDEHPGSQ